MENQIKVDLEKKQYRNWESRKKIILILEELKFNNQYRYITGSYKSPAVK